jgi:hypothetical protein
MSEEFVLPYTDRNDLAPCLDNSTETTQLLKNNENPSKSKYSNPRPNV